MSVENYIVEVDKYGCPTTETGMAVIEVVKKRHWLYNDEDTRIITAKTAEEVKDVVGIPVGGVGFTQKYAGKIFQPINIPDVLKKFSFLQRRIGRGSKETLIAFIKENELNEIFVKSDTKYKGMFAEPYGLKQLEQLDGTGQYFFSEVVNIEAEWRVFVFNETIVDVRMYLGDWRDNEFIPIDFIEEVVDSYVDSPKAYTLDIGITEDGDPLIVEVHNFVSCGLYGFNSKDILQMVTAAYKEEIGEGNRVGYWG